MERAGYWLLTKIPQMAVQRLPGSLSNFVVDPFISLDGLKEAEVISWCIKDTVGFHPGFQIDKGAEHPELDSIQHLHHTPGMIKKSQEF